MTDPDPKPEVPGASTPGPLALWFDDRANATEHVYVDAAGTTCTARLAPPTTSEFRPEVRIRLTPADGVHVHGARPERRVAHLPEAAARALHAALGEQIGVLAELHRLVDEADRPALITTDGAAAGHTTEA